MANFSTADDQFIIDNAASMTAREIGEALTPKRTPGDIYQAARRLGVSLSGAKRGKQQSPASVTATFEPKAQLWGRVPADMDQAKVADALTLLARHLGIREKGRTVAEVVLYAARKAREEGAE